MSTTAAYTERPASYLADWSLRSWLLTTDHKRIGLMYLASTAVALVVGGAFALLMRLELLTPASDLVRPLTYNRFFTMHGVIMVWLFMIPAIPAGFGNFLLPIMIGAKDVAFPRLNLASLYIYWAGFVVIMAGLALGGADTGWTFYPPYSGQTTTAVATIAIGVFVLAISSSITGINFVVSTHTLRASGLTWMRMPLFVWSIYATSIVLIFATPVLGMALLLVAVDHAFGMGIFDPALGGDPILYQHLFWFYSHPAVYIMVLPAMGVISEVVPTFSHKNTFSYRAIAFSTLGIALVGMLTWGHHMFVAGMSGFDVGVFGVLSMFVAIFSAIKVFTWVATLYRGSISVKTPLVYFFEFLFLFGFGGMTGVALASTSLDIQWHDTYFIVAHFHFVMVGAVMSAYLAALHYWWPKLFGRMYPERLAMLAAFLVFAGFLLTFVPQFLLGNAGMPRRYASYPAEYQVLNVLSTVGSWALASGVVLTLSYLLWSLRKGTRAGDNPWDSWGFEWRTLSPPPEHNFIESPVFAHGPHEYWREGGAEDGDA